MGNQMGQIGMGNQMGQGNMFNNMCNNMNNNMLNNMCNNMNNNMFNNMCNNMNNNMLNIMCNNMNNNMFNNMCNNMNNNMLNIMCNNMNNNMNMTNCNNQGNNNDLRNINENGYDPFESSVKRRINIYFENQKGKKIIIRAPENITLLELIEGFFKKVGILNPNYQNEVNFLYNGKSLKELITHGNKGNEPISELGFTDFNKILVIDFKDFVGA